MAEKVQCFSCGHGVPKDQAAFHPSYVEPGGGGHPVVIGDVWICSNCETPTSKSKETFTNGDVLCILEYARAASKKLGQDQEEVLRELHLTPKKWKELLGRFAMA